MRTERKIFFCPTLLVTPLCAWSIWKIFAGNRQKVWVEIRLNEHSFIYAMIKKKQFVLSFSYVSAHWDKVSCCSLWDLKSSNQVNGSKAGSLPELHPGRCWVAPQQVRKLAFFPPLSKTNTASDWSIYSRDFTRVHLEELNAFVLFSLITLDIFQLTHRYRYQFVGEVMTDMWSIKEMIQCVTIGIPKGMKKISFYFYCFLRWLFDAKSKYSFWGMLNKKLFEIILRVGRVTSLQSWVAKNSCHGQTLINECSFSWLPSNFEGRWWDSNSQPLGYKSSALASL